MNCETWEALQNNIMDELRRLASWAKDESQTHIEIGQDDPLAVALRRLHVHELEHRCSPLMIVPSERLMAQYSA